MKLSLNEAKLTGLWASHCVTYSTGLDFQRALEATWIQSTGGSVVEFSPATREARVRFPASALVFFPFYIVLVDVITF